MYPSLSRSRLGALADAHRDSYAGARPFPHAVVDGLLPPGLSEDVAASFPSSSLPGFRRRDYPEQSGRYVNLQKSDFDGVDPVVRHVLRELGGQVFLDFLTRLTGARGLIADPHFRGAGLHITEPGGHLNLHADYNVDRFRGLVRRLSIVLYVQPSPDWTDAWNGHLELWPADLQSEPVRYAPLHNRLVVFDYGDDYYHGHPAPLRCPPGRCRQSFAAYYFVAPDETGLPAARSARWVEPHEPPTT